MLHFELRVNHLHDDEESYGCSGLHDKSLASPQMKAWNSTSVHHQVRNHDASRNLLIWHCCFISSSTNHTRRVQLAAHMFPGFIRNQPEVSPASLTRQEIKKDSPISRVGGGVFHYFPAGVMISVKKHIIQISLLLVFPLTLAFLLHLNITLVTGTILVLSEQRRERQVHRWI